MRKSIFFISFSLLVLQVAAQQYNTWYFGGGAGISFNAGGTTIPYTLTDGINSANEGNASISDANGNLLFYTNGETVYNRTHHVMMNGNNMLGNISAAQSSLIIPLPNDDSIYYLFTTDAEENDFVNGYRYSVINMRHDGGNGEVVIKNSLLNSSCTERLAAVRHANGIDVWVIGNEKNSNIFKAWLLTCTGLKLTPVISAVGIVLNNEDKGTIKVSPDGAQLCQTNYPDLTGNFFQLFDFDKTTGILSNPILISNPNVGYFSCEFSPDSKLLYVTRAFEAFIDQFESKLGTATAINASRVSIPATFGFYGIQTGPDEKIYLNRFKTKLSVISNPNMKGVACTFEQDKIDLKNRNGILGLPSAINDGPVDPSNNFTATIIDSCNGVVQFNGFTNMGGSLQWLWDFGDGNTTTIQNPQHVFNPYDQLYNVKLTIRSLTGCGYVEKAKKIAPGGMFVKPDFDFVAKCDSGYVRFINKSTIFPDDGTVQYAWDFGDGNTSTQKDPVHTYAGSGLFPVKLKIKTSVACLDDSITKSLDLQQLDIHAPPDQTIDAGQTVQLFVTGGGSTYQWSPSQWLSDPTIANPVARPQDDITYTVTATNDAGCVDVDSVFIHLNPVPGIYMPTGFTPGNDGLNDIIKPIISGDYTLDQFTIFNRWGQRVFSTTEIGKGWDGMFGGKLQNSGMYVWIIKAKDPQKKKIEMKGTLALIR